jgi:hypothetical protein
MSKRRRILRPDRRQGRGRDGQRQARLSGAADADDRGGHPLLGASQLYVSIGDKTQDGKLVVRVWWKPWILCVWGGALVMIAGGFVSLSDRRLRVGAPSRRARPIAAMGAAE